MNRGKERICIAILLAFAAMVEMASGQSISTVAGTGTAGFSGDGGPATSANLNNARGVFVDSLGNLFIADTNNQRIRKVNVSGNISTVAGTGTAGFSGDGGAATGANLNSPGSVYVDVSGNLFIVDRNNNRIRKVDTSGTISTVAGTGTAGFSGDGGAATGANLNSPGSVYVDVSGNLFIADTNNQRIRKVNVSGNISTVAGTGTSGFSGDGGAATSAQLSNPNALYVDGSGNLLIADTNNHRIRKVNVSGNISTVAGTGTSGFSGDGGAATNATINTPYSVFVDGSGNLYISDSFNNRIRKVDASGNISTATSASIPGWIFVDGAGNIFFPEVLSNRIRKLNAIPAVPGLVTANSTAFQRHLSVVLDWGDVTGATSYTLEHANNSGFTNPTTVSGLSTSQYTFSSPPVDGTYYWRVKAVGSGGTESSFSSSRSFSIIPTFQEWTMILLASAMMGYLLWHQRATPVRTR